MPTGGGGAKSLLFYLLKVEQAMDQDGLDQVVQEEM